MPSYCIPLKHHATGRPLQIHLKVRPRTTVRSVLAKVKALVVRSPECQMLNYDKIYIETSAVEGILTEISKADASRSMADMGLGVGCVLYLDGPFLPEAELEHLLARERLLACPSVTCDKPLSRLWDALKNEISLGEVMAVTMSLSSIDYRAVERRATIDLLGKSPSKGLLRWTYAEISPLVLATLAGRVDVMEAFIRAGAIVSEPRPLHTRTYTKLLPPLYVAAYIGNVAAINLLVANGADVNAVISIFRCRTQLERCKDYLEKYVSRPRTDGQKSYDVHGGTALHFAACSGHEAVVRALIDKRADVNAVNWFGFTALHIAARHGHTDVIRLLIAGGCWRYAANSRGHTAMHVAAVQGHIDALQALAFGADEAALKVACVGCLPLAIKFKQWTSVSFFLSEGLDASPASGRESLLIALQRTDLLLFEKLLDNGILLDEFPIEAIMDRDYDTKKLLTLLADRGTDLNIQYHPKNVQEGKGTFLHAYAARTFISGTIILEAKVKGVFDYILAEVVDAASLDSLGRTALHCAVEGEVRTLSYLIERYRFSVNAADFEGKTPLHLATPLWCEDAMATLLKSGARVDVVDIHGNTPLHALAERGARVCISMVRLLIRAGANRAAKNNDGMTPLDVYLSSTEHTVMNRNLDANIVQILNT